MKHFLRLLTVLSSAAMLAVSCLDIDGDVTLFTDYAMGKVTDGVFYADDGIAYHLTNLTADQQLDTVPRVLVSVNATEKISDTEYKGTASEIYSVDIMETIAKSQIPDFDNFATDEAGFTNGWFSGGYFNVCVKYAQLDDKDTDHKFYLVYDDERSTKGDLYLILRHDAQGMSYINTEYAASDFTFKSWYLSFPITKVLNMVKNDDSTCQVTVEWAFPESDGYTYSRVNTDHSYSAKLTIE